MAACCSGANTFQLAPARFQPCWSSTLAAGIVAAQLMPGVEKVSRDLQSSGYLALAVTYRLARCGRITGQDPNYEDPLSGRPPEQTDDIKSLMKAACSLTTLCNGSVVVFGGSAGGSPPFFVPLKKTPTPPTTYPNW